MTTDKQIELIELVKGYGVFYSMFNEKLDANDDSYKTYKRLAAEKLKKIEELIA
tara:strand:- start:134 stop:295 length:162 start_codon:yes stop_codon:yes gene_type:complete